MELVDPARWVSLVASVVLHTGWALTFFLLTGLLLFFALFIDSARTSLLTVAVSSTASSPRLGSLLLLLPSLYLGLFFLSFILHFYWLGTAAATTSSSSWLLFFVI